MINFEQSTVYESKVDFIHFQFKCQLKCELQFQNVPTSRLASLPPAFISDKPYANYYGLALIALPPEEDDKVEAAKVFGQDALNRNLLLNVEYKYERISKRQKIMFTFIKLDFSSFTGWMVSHLQR